MSIGQAPCGQTQDTKPQYGAEGEEGPKSLTEGQLQTKARNQLRGRDAQLDVNLIATDAWQH